MDEKDNSILFQSEDGTEVRFSVISETKLNGKNYVLVTEPDGEEAFILREKGDDNEDIVYEMVDDDISLVSIYYGSDVSEEEANAISEEVLSKHSDIDVEVQSGGQPIYYYVVSAE